MPRRWEPDPEELTREWAQATSVRDLANRLGVNRTTLYEWAVRSGVDLAPLRSPGGPERRPRPPAAAPPEADGYPDPDPDPDLTDQELLKICEDRGIAVLKRPVREDLEYELETPALDGQGTIRAGVVSDVHLGSRYQQITYLNAAYDWFAREEIPVVFNPGDVTGGSDRMHPGMELELFVHGADEQAEYAHEAYPARSGITTYLISGNHDHSHLKSGGSNVVKRIAADRADLEYLGMSGAYVTINGIRIYLHHPSGGVPYARSYRLQKQIEQFAPELKPKVLITGHLHVTCVLESYRNVFGFLAGAFEAQTPYLVEKGVYPELGFSILEITYNDQGAVRFRKEWIPFYVPRTEDHPGYRR